MTPQLLKAYKAERAKGTYARRALLHARTLVEWRACEWRGFGNANVGDVNLKIEADEYQSFEDLTGDTYNPKANPDIPRTRLEREAKAEQERIDRDGVWGIVGQYYNGDAWVDCDAVWGFIGEDWRDSGYDSDVMRQTLDARNAFMNSQLLVGAV